MNIPFSPPDITDLEIQEVIAAMKSGWITTGPKTKLFEKKIAEYCGTSKAVCLNSATAAMEMTLRVLGIGLGDEVITSAYTYTASASVIHHVGAKIVLVDVAAGSFHMDPEKLADAITEKTKAVIPVDIGGVMCDYDAIYEVLQSKKYLFHPGNNEIQKLFDRAIVVADAAHSFGATYRSQRCGSVADFSCFSFHAVKNPTTAEGGAITWRDRDGMDNDALYNRFMLYTLHGQSKDALAKMRPGAWEYDIVYPAWKCNMTDITAAMGLVQISRFDGLTARRKQVIRMYDDALLPLGIRRLQHFGDNFEGNGHLYLMRITGISEQRRNEIILKMAETGVACNVHFKPLPMHTAYKNLGFDIADFPNAYRQYANEITLPLHTLLTDEQVLYLIDALKGILSGNEPRALFEDDLEIIRVWDTSHDDIRAVYDIIKECGERMFIDDGLLHWATPLPIDFIRMECLEKEFYIVKDKVSGKPIATFNMTNQPSMYFDLDKKAMYMQRLAVSPEYWNKGIGTQCFRFVAERAKKDGCECLRSSVYEASDRAVTFLKRRGYRELYKRHSKHFVVLCMERELLDRHVYRVSQLFL